MGLGLDRWELIENRWRVSYSRGNTWLDDESITP